MKVDYKLTLGAIEDILNRIEYTLNNPFYGEIFIRKPYENSISYILHCCYNLEDFVIVFNLGGKHKHETQDIANYLKEILLERNKERCEINGK